MSSKPELKLDWCSYAAAKYAVEHWHYSKTMPVGKLSKVGVWEDAKFVGSIIFGLGGGGACNGRKYGLRRNLDMAELQRIAMTEHRTPVSRCLSIACAFIKKQSAGLRLLISYADPEQKHHGGVYQAAGWIYTGVSEPDWKAVWPDGRVAHSRIARGHTQFGQIKIVDTSKAVRVPIPGKHRYLMPLDAEMRARILPLSKPYPKRAIGDTKDTPANHAGEGGSTPTIALQFSSK